MEFKAGINVVGIRPETVLAITLLAEVYKELNLRCCITEVLAQRGHSRASLHYAGAAFDVGIRHINGDLFDPGVVQRLQHEVQRRLGAQYEVIAEPDHIHVEFQPKVI